MDANSSMASKASLTRLELIESFLVVLIVHVGVCGSLLGHRVLDLDQLKSVGDLVEHLIGQWVSVLVRVDHSSNFLEVGPSLDLVAHRKDALHDHSLRRLQELVDEEDFVLWHLNS